MSASYVIGEPLKGEESWGIHYKSNPTKKSTDLTHIAKREPGVRAGFFFVYSILKRGIDTYIYFNR